MVRCVQVLYINAPECMYGTVMGGWCRCTTRSGGLRCDVRIQAWLGHQDNWWWREKAVRLMSSFLFRLIAIAVDGRKATPPKLAPRPYTAISHVRPCCCHFNAMMTMTMIMINGQNQNKLFIVKMYAYCHITMKNILLFYYSLYLKYHHIYIDTNIL